jgi:hypothetical protein
MLQSSLICPVMSDRGPLKDAERPEVERSAFERTSILPSRNSLRVRPAERLFVEGA